MNWQMIPSVGTGTIFCKWTSFLSLWLFSDSYSMRLSMFFLLRIGGAKVPGWRCSTHEQRFEAQFNLGIYFRGLYWQVSAYPGVGTDGELVWSSCGRTEHFLKAFSQGYKKLHSHFSGLYIFDGLYEHQWFICTLLTHLHFL